MMQSRATIENVTIEHVTIENLTAESASAEKTTAASYGDNPLVTVANPLLNAISQIRYSATHANPIALRQQLVDEIRRFEIRCQSSHFPYEVIIGARYCLCTVLDEAVALTPWGSVWAGHGLLVTFHNETWGGEKFFQLLAKLSQNPREHLHLLELINFCLLLGFEGRYRVVENGRSQLETMKRRLLQLIRSVRGGYAQALSQQILDRPVLNRKWRPMIPLWACAALMGLLACLLYITLNWRLGDATSPLLAAIYQTHLPQITVQSPPVLVKPKPALNLKNFLSKEIAEELVTVRDEADRSVVTLRGDGLFSSGSTTIRERYLPVIDRIAAAMNNVSGQVLITGYSDNVPIRSARFASNYELSLERARSVLQQLQPHLGRPQRAKAEGRGDSDPLVPNSSVENRSRNRRVEITLLVAPDNTQSELNVLPQG